MLLLASPLPVPFAALRTIITKQSLLLSFSLLNLGENHASCARLTSAILSIILVIHSSRKPQLPTGAL